MGVRYWPPSIPREATVAAFDLMLKSFGFSECVKRTLEKGVHKVALYMLAGSPKHMAKQTEKGKWSSKLGDEQDVEHLLDALEGPEYGTVYKVYCRPS